MVVNLGSLVEILKVIYMLKNKDVLVEPGIKDL